MFDMLVSYTPAIDAILNLFSCDHRRLPCSGMEVSDETDRGSRCQSFLPFLALFLPNQIIKFFYLYDIERPDSKTLSVSSFTPLPEY